MNGRELSKSQPISNTQSTTAPPSSASIPMKKNEFYACKGEDSRKREQPPVFSSGSVVRDNDDKYYRFFSDSESTLALKHDDGSYQSPFAMLASSKPSVSQSAPAEWHVSELMLFTFDEDIAEQPQAQSWEQPEEKRKNPLAWF